MIITDLVMGFLNFIEKVLIVWFIVRMFGFQKISRWNWAADCIYFDKDTGVNISTDMTDYFNSFLNELDELIKKYKMEVDCE